MLIIAISRFALYLIPERSEFVRTEKVANETYEQYSQQLEAICNESAKEIEAKKE